MALNGFDEISRILREAAVLVGPFGAFAHDVIARYRQVDGLDQIKKQQRTPPSRWSAAEILPCGSASSLLRALAAMSEKGPSNGSARNFRTTIRASLIASVDPSPPPDR